LYSELASLRIQVVILDCGHAISITRDIQEEISPRGRIRSIKIRRPLSDTVDSDILKEKGIRGANLRSFEYYGTASHVLLTACGAHNFANEKNVRGTFTESLLEIIERIGYSKLTYAELLRNLPKAHR
jgi:hypothetical protein